MDITTATSRRFRRLALATGIVLCLLGPGQVALASDLPIGPRTEEGSRGPGDLIPEPDPDCKDLSCGDDPAPDPEDQIDEDRADPNPVDEPTEVPDADDSVDEAVPAEPTFTG